MSLQIFPFLWEREALLICKVMALVGERERERERERLKARCRLREERGRTSKGRDAKYTHPIFGSTCASISRSVGFTRGS